MQRMWMNVGSAISFNTGETKAVLISWIYTAFKWLMCTRFKQCTGSRDNFSTSLHWNWDVMTETNDHHYGRGKCVNYCCISEGTEISWREKFNLKRWRSEERNVNELITHAFLLQKELPRIGCNKFATIIK